MTKLSANTAAHLTAVRAFCRARRPLAIRVQTQRSQHRERTRTTTHSSTRSPTTAERTDVVPDARGWWRIRKRGAA